MRARSNRDGCSPERGTTAACCRAAPQGGAVDRAPVEIFRAIEQQPEVLFAVNVVGPCSPARPYSLDKTYLSYMGQASRKQRLTIDCNADYAWKLNPLKLLP